MNPELIENIPRLHTALAEWLACLVYILQLPHRRRGAGLWGRAAGFLAVQAAFLYLTDDVPLALWMPCMAVAAAGMLTMIAVCGRTPLAEAGYLCVRAFMLAEFAASLEWQLYTYIVQTVPGWGVWLRVLVPAVVFAGVYLLLYWLDVSLPALKRPFIWRKAALLFICALALWEARCAPPQYLYPEYVEYDALVEQHADEPCVYFTDDYFAPITQDLLQLMHFENFYVTNDRGCADMLDYLGGSDSFVAYIDISEYWSSGYKPEEILALIAGETDYDEAQLLYQNGLSATYVISK